MVFVAINLKIGQVARRILMIIKEKLVAVKKVYKTVNAKVII